MEANKYVSIKVSEPGNYRLRIHIRAGQDQEEVFLFVGRRRLCFRGRIPAGNDFIHECVLNVCDMLQEGTGDFVSGDHIEVKLEGGSAEITDVEVQRTGCPTLFLSGDSTVTDQEGAEPYDPGVCYCGWGQMLPLFLTGQISVSNHAHSGLTTESFRGEGHYDIVRQNWKPGDFYLMQFGHNDQKRPHLQAEGGYRENLIRYIRECRNAGVFPVIVTPIARNTWQNQGEVYSDWLEEFAAVCRSVGMEYEIPVLDLHERSREFVLDNGLEAAKAYFHPGDFTHTNDYGGVLAAGWIAEEIRRVCSGFAEYETLTRGVVSETEAKERAEWGRTQKKVPQQQIKVQKAAEGIQNEIDWVKKMQYVKFAERVLHPSEEFTPIPFWFFNDMPDEGKIRRQLEDYVDKGVNGIVLHPRIGIPKEIPYLSEQYFAAVRFIVETAAQLDMKVILYDEGMYPSGSAHGMVVEQEPGFASRGITIRETPGTGEVITELPDGRYLVYDFTGGTIRGIHFGEDDGETGAPASADILNPDAVELFIHLTHDQYYGHLKEYFGNTVIAFFTDEPCALGRNAAGYREWVPGMEKEILAAGGHLEELAELFEKKPDEQNRTIQMYRKLIKGYLREIFYRRLSEWCSDHGISLIGHPETSDDVEEQFYFQIPGQDLIMRRVVPKTGGLLEFDSVQTKLAADIARHLGRRRNANECFGVCYREQLPWYFTAEDMKWYIDWLGLRGVNLFIPHAFYYSVEGARSGERPPDVGPNNIWWEYYKRFADYMKRLSFLMTDSVNGARAAVLCDNNRVPCQEIAAFYENQVEFNYLPVSLLQDCTVSDGKLCIRGYEYEAVYDPLGISDQKMGLECGAEEILGNPEWRSIVTDGCFPGLRAVRLTKDGIKMLLLSNEGNQDISGKWRPDKEGAPVRIDLWKGSYDRVSIDQDGWSELCLDSGETCLYLFDHGEIETPCRETGEYLGDWTERFWLVERSENRAVYETVFEMVQAHGDEYFQVTGEEMMECFCNNEFVDVSFWNDHRFVIGRYLQTGKNVIRLVATGNAVNLFTDAHIAFGLGVRG